MKKRLISLLLCLVLCAGLLPMAALAEDIEPLAAEKGEAMPEPTAEPAAEPEAAVEPEATAEPTAEPTATPEVTVEPTAEPTTAPEVTPEPTAEPEPTVEPEPDPVAQVQALLDALPDAETVTADTRAAVEAQLTAIDDARLALDDDSTLDYTRYAAVVAALEALDGTPGASEPELLGNNGNRDYQDLQAMINDAEAFTAVYLQKDYTIDQTLVINKTAITLDLQGHTLTGNVDGPVIEVDDRMYFTLTSSQPNGKVTNNKTNTKGLAAGVYVNGGTLELAGNVTIYGCHTSKPNSAGGVYVPSGTTFTMNGDSKIEFCRVECPYNEAPEKVAGGVYNEGSFTTSGAVTGCNIW